MSYTNNIRMDAICNYLNLETKNASHMSLPCINKGKERDVAIHDLRLSQSNLVLLLYYNLLNYFYLL